MSGDVKSKANDSALFSVEELAELAGVSKTSIRREIARGALAAVHVGRLVRVPISAWQAYLEAHRVRGRLMPVPPTKKRAASADAAPPQLQ